LNTVEFQEHRSDRVWQIVDVRSQEELAVSIIPGAIPLADYFKRIKEFSRQPALVYCTIGCRSTGHTQILSAQGVEAYNLWGGVVDWARHGGEFRTLDGKPTRNVHTHGKRWNLLPYSYKAVW
jgi:rhodanese-related sulfurtransferase